MNFPCTLSGFQLAMHLNVHLVSFGICTAFTAALVVLFCLLLWLTFFCSACLSLCWFFCLLLLLNLLCLPGSWFLWLWFVFASFWHCLVRLRILCRRGCVWLSLLKLFSSLLLWFRGSCGPACSSLSGSPAFPAISGWSPSLAFLSSSRSFSCLALFAFGGLSSCVSLCASMTFAFLILVFFAASDWSCPPVALLLRPLVVFARGFALAFGLAFALPFALGLGVLELLLCSSSLPSDSSSVSSCFFPFFLLVLAAFVSLVCSVGLTCSVDRITCKATCNIAGTNMYIYIYVFYFWMSREHCTHFSLYKHCPNPDTHIHAHAQTKKKCLKHQPQPFCQEDLPEKVLKGTLEQASFFWDLQGPPLMIVQGQGLEHPLLTDRAQVLTPLKYHTIFLWPHACHLNGECSVCKWTGSLLPFLGGYFP